MGEHEHRRVIGRVVAPPALPLIVRPGAARGAEHIAAENPGADPLNTARGKIVVDPNCPAATAEHRLKRACRENPFVQLGAAHAQRVVQILTGTGRKSVERYAEAVNAKFGHSVSFFS